jgi:hypothetical protein
MPVTVDEAALLSDLRELIQSARQRIALRTDYDAAVLAGATPQSLQDERAPYGKRILATVSRELTVEFGQALPLALSRHSVLSA